MKIICIGRNYRDHILEMDSPLPEAPLFFMKPETALIRAGLPFFYPDFSSDIHYEAELVLRICKVGKNIQQRFAPRYYHEIGVGIDFTARDVQQRCIREGLPWEMAKAFDGSGPVSRFVPLQSLPNPENIAFSLKKNGQTMQHGLSSQMIFSFNQIIAHVSQFTMLKIGDLIFTGTPAGVGPVQIGDRLEVFLEKEKMLQIDIK
jgi:2-keto-4-pentenoate hydratase/2-oxohepta-3-ene-1,7-dioic acid hydratase in catechol pathway